MKYVCVHNDILDSDCDDVFDSVCLSEWSIRYIENGLSIIYDYEYADIDDYMFIVRFSHNNRDVVELTDEDITWCQQNALNMYHECSTIYNIENEAGATIFIQINQYGIFVNKCVLDKAESDIIGYYNNRKYVVYSDANGNGIIVANTDNTPLTDADTEYLSGCSSEIFSAFFKD